MLRRGRWGVADQALSSLTNFLVGIVIARTLGPEQFGAFGLAFVTYTLGLSLSEALASQPLLIRFSDTPEPAWRNATAAAAGVALWVGALLALGCLLVGLLAEGAVGPVYLALGIAAPGLLLQDTWRMAFFAAGRDRAAFTNDLVWTVILIPVFAIAIWGGEPSLFKLTLGWGGAATAAAVFGMVQSRVTPAPGQAMRWVRDHRDLGPRFVVEAVALSGAAQVTVAGVGAVAGLPAVAGIRGAQMLLGPIQIFTKGFRLVLIPTAVSALRRSTSEVRRVCATYSLMMSSATLACGLLLLLIPDSWGEWILGATWRPVESVLLPVTIGSAAAANSRAASAGLRALAAAARSLVARLIASSLQIIGGLLGAVVGAGLGAAWGLGIASTLAAAIYWRSLLTAFNEHHHRHRPSADVPSAGNGDTAAPAEGRPD